MMERAEQYSDILAAGRPTAPGATSRTPRLVPRLPTPAWPFLEHVKTVSDEYPEVPPVVATHKGFALPGFDQRGAAPRDVGPAARRTPA